MLYQVHHEVVSDTAVRAALIKAKVTCNALHVILLALLERGVLADYEVRANRESGDGNR